jgi:hypothetical protein
MAKSVTIPSSDLPTLIDRAATALQSARSSAEVLQAGALANFAYDAAKSAARLAKAKEAHDDVLTKVYRAQADAALIEAGAKCRLADEYDAAQERGEVAKPGSKCSGPEHLEPATAAEIGISRKDIYEARIIRDAEKAEPGIVRKTLDAALEAGEEPTKAKVRQAAEQATGRAKPAARPSDDDSEEVAELRHIIEDLKAENTDLKAQLAELEPMRLEYERGGFAAIVGRMAETIKGLKTRVESESREKVQNLRRANFWQQEAVKRGYSRNAEIDLETGEVT